MRTIVTIFVALAALPFSLSLVQSVEKLNQEADTAKYIDLAAAGRACPAVSGRIADSLRDGRLTNLEYLRVSDAYAEAVLAQEKRQARDAALRDSSLIPTDAPPPTCRQMDPKTGKRVMPSAITEERSKRS